VYVCIGWVISGVGALRDKGLRSPLLSYVLLVLSDYTPHPIPILRGRTVIHKAYQPQQVFSALILAYKASVAMEIGHQHPRRPSV